jgi:phosphomevalonate kinase
VVPGAGGYDAVVLLVEDRPEVLERLDKVLEGWKVDVVGEGEEVGSGPKIGRVSRLPVREEMEGIRGEDVGRYGGWIV